MCDIYIELELHSFSNLTVLVDSPYINFLLPSNVHCSTAIYMYAPTHAFLKYEGLKYGLNLTFYGHSRSNLSGIAHIFDNPIIAQ